MNANENIHATLPEDVIELGVASTDTKGQVDFGEVNGREGPSGISAE